MGDNTSFNVTPSASFYGIYPQAAAQMLVQDPNNPAYIGMYGLAQRSQRDYEAAMQRALAAEAVTSQDNNRASIAAHVIDHGADLSKAGILHYLNPTVTGYLNLDNPGLAQADVQHLDESAASALKDRGAGIKDIADSTGVTPSPQQVGDYFGGALGNVVPMQKTQSSDNEIKLKDAEAHLMSAKASQTRAAKGVGDSTTTISIYDPTTGTYQPMSQTTKHGSGPAQAPASNGPAAGGAITIKMRSGQVRTVSPLVAQSLIKQGVAEQVQ